MNTLTTQGIKVMVETTYEPYYSDPDAQRCFFRYDIVIENNSDYTIQILRRHWKIQDSDGSKREVEGEGIVGQQPVLKPGEKHSYSSRCPLNTDMGVMSGTFLTERQVDGAQFNVVVPAFFMQAPFRLN